MKIRDVFFVVISLLIFIRCEKETEVQSKDYPYVITRTPNINADGVGFSALITSIGKEEILKYGFVWSQESNPTIHDYNKLFEEMPGKGEYTYDVKGGFEKGKTYYVRAYMLTTNLEVYGNEKSFISQGSLRPVIRHFEPQFGSTGTKVIITGENFALSKTGNRVKLGDVEAIVDSVSENQLVITIPEISKPEKVKIAIETAGMEVTSNAFFDLWFPWRKLGLYGLNTYLAATFSRHDKGYIIQRNTTDLIEYSPNEHSFRYHSSLPENSSPYPLAAQSDSRIIAVLNTHVYELEKQSFTWSLISKLPMVRTDEDYIFCFDNHIYVGSYANGALYKFDMVNLVWITVQSSGIKKPFWYTYSSSNNRGSVFLVPSYRSTPSLHIFDPNTNSWEIKSDIPADLNLSWSHFQLGNKVFAGLGYAGGWSNGYASNQIWSYDLAEKKWTQYLNCPQRIKETTLSMSIGNKGYIFTYIGTYSNVMSEVWEFDPSKN
jgi:hypothetical protein